MTSSGTLQHLHLVLLLLFFVPFLFYNVRTALLAIANILFAVSLDDPLLRFVPITLFVLLLAPLILYHYYYMRFSAVTHVLVVVVVVVVWVGLVLIGSRGLLSLRSFDRMRHVLTKEFREVTRAVRQEIARDENPNTPWIAGAIVLFTPIVALSFKSVEDILGFVLATIVFLHFVEGLFRRPQQ